MTHKTTFTVAQLEDAAADLRRQIAEDNSQLDHLTNGRWPVLHRLVERIEAAKASEWIARQIRGR